MLNSERENMGLNPEGLKIMGFYKGFLAEDFLKNKGFWTLNDLEKTLIEEVECKFDVRPAFCESKNMVEHKLHWSGTWARPK